jgi:universal stress protein A
MYQNVLVAVDLSEKEAYTVLSRARSLAEDAAVTVVHVVEPQYIQYSFDPTFTGSMIKTLEDEAQRSARRRVASLCEPFDIPETSQLVAFGHASTIIKKMIEDEGYDLLVIGTHGRRGSRWILGSTANSVLHGTQIDVQAIRIPEDA